MFEARAELIFGGNCGFCQIGGQPENSQPKIKKITDKNLNIFDNLIFRIFAIDIVYGFAIMQAQMASARLCRKAEVKKDKLKAKVP